MSASSELVWYISVLILEELAKQASRRMGGEIGCVRPSFETRPCGRSQCNSRHRERERSDPESREGSIASSLLLLRSIAAPQATGGIRDFVGLTDLRRRTNPSATSAGDISSSTADKQAAGLPSEWRTCLKPRTNCHRCQRHDKHPYMNIGIHSH
jgi:hypothetical protein